MRKLASIQIIDEIFPIADADRIEVAKIGGWNVVVQKDQFKAGNKVVYCEIDSMFLEKFPEIEFLWEKQTPKKIFVDFKEVEGIVLKTVKLRGVVSQGLILPLSVLEGKKYTNDNRENPEYDFKVGKDVSELLGIIKYEKPIPANLAGEVKGNFPGFCPKTDETRIQSCMKVLEEKKGELIYIASKLDGSSTTYFKKDGEFGVCSRNLELKETEENSLWNIAKKYDLHNKLPEGFAIQGEVVGPKIQGNPLKLSDIDICIFNVWHIKEARYLDFEDMIDFCQTLGIKTVPIIAKDIKLNHTFEELMTIAEQKSPLATAENQEGIVVRPMKEQIANIDGSITRFSFKVISNLYLLNE